MSEVPTIFKIITIGMSGVGKTSFITRYVDDLFMFGKAGTIGVDFKVKTIQINEQKYRLVLWDTAGQERFRSISAAYYRKANGLIFAMDPSQPDSLQTIARLMEDAMHHCPQQIPKILITTKNDLGLNEWKTDSDAIDQFAEKNGMPVFRTSAKTGENVELAVESLATLMIIEESKNQQNQGFKSLEKNKEEQQQQKQKGTCC